MRTMLYRRRRWEIGESGSAAFEYATLWQLSYRYGFVFPDCPGDATIDERREDVRQRADGDVRQAESRCSRCQWSGSLRIRATTWWLISREI